MRGRLTAIRASCGARQFEGCDRGSVARLWSSERDGLLLDSSGVEVVKRIIVHATLFGLPLVQASVLVQIVVVSNKVTQACVSCTVECVRSAEFLTRCKRKSWR